MDVGLQLIFSSYGWDDLSDVDVYKQETELAMMAEELGFDCIWPTEHHFATTPFAPTTLSSSHTSRGEPSASILVRPR